MEKVLFICASPRKNGNTAQVLSKCADTIEKHGLKTEIIYLQNKNIESCHACGKCAKIKKCKIDDGLNGIIDKIRDSKGFIVGTPVYFGTARGDLMAALQRIGYVSMNTDRFLSWKVGGPIAVASRGGQTSTIQELLMFYLINEMIVPGSTYWNMVFGREKGDAVKDEEGMQTIRNFGKNVAKTHHQNSVDFIELYQ
jgi:multimeric flavodoxin WrbA